MDKVLEKLNDYVGNKENYYPRIIYPNYLEELINLDNIAPKKYNANNYPKFDFNEPKLYYFDNKEPTKNGFYFRGIIKLIFSIILSISIIYLLSSIKSETKNGTVIMFLVFTLSILAFYCALLSFFDLKITDKQLEELLRKYNNELSIYNLSKTNYELYTKSPNEYIQEKINTYNKEKLEFLNKMEQEYKLNVILNRTKSLKRTKLSEFLKQKIEDNIRQVSEDELKLVKRGAAERDFEFQLCQKFQGYISCNYSNNDKYTNIKYYPDICYWDKESNIFIDIEIDEPYTLIDKKPIHCFDQDKDSYRDSILVEKYFWIIIRFSEYQVLRYPNFCIETVEKIINNIFEKGKLLKFDNVITSHLKESENDKSKRQLIMFSKFIHKRWSEKISIKLSDDNTREEVLRQYLNL